MCPPVKITAPAAPSCLCTVAVQKNTVGTKACFLHSNGKTQHLLPGTRLPLHHGMLLCTITLHVTHFRHTRISNSIPSPAAMHSTTAITLHGGKAGGESMSRAPFAKPPRHIQWPKERRGQRQDANAPARSRTVCCSLLLCAAHQFYTGHVMFRWNSRLTFCI